MPLAPVVLRGRHVRLEPLAPEHAAPLREIARDPDLWRWTWEHPRTDAAFRAYLDEAWRQRDEGTALPFAILQAHDGAVAGCTRFGSFVEPHGRVEIGWTWVGAPWRRTPVNTEAKHLLLRHAFETLKLRRVEWKTDALNRRSRDALLRLGAVEEGIFRRHGVTHDGRVRDTAWYSIVDDEWPAVKARPEALLARPWPAA